MGLVVRLPDGRLRTATAEWVAGLVDCHLTSGARPLRRDSTFTTARHTLRVHLSLRGGGGDEPDWTERGRVPGGSSKRRGPDARAPDWHGDAKKYAAKIEQEKRERGELLLAVGPYCVPCGKRFAKQTVYDAHLSGQKHLRALERLGRAEEAMVCRLDVEAKRRKLQEARERDDAARASVSGAPAAHESEEVVARRKAEREEKLRQRSMLPMPTSVSASSVYEEASSVPPSAQVVPLVVPDAAELAAAAAGTSKSFYTSGMQDLSDRTNRFTSAEKMELHRKMAIAPSDWFGKGIHSSNACSASNNGQDTTGATASSTPSARSAVFSPGLRIVEDDEHKEAAR